MCGEGKRVIYFSHMHKNTIIFLVAIAFLVGVMYVLRTPAPPGGHPVETEEHTHGTGTGQHTH